MRKYADTYGDEYPRPRRGARLTLWAGLLLALAASPFLYEWGLTVYAHWQDMLGTHVAVRTPLLDYLADARRSAGEAWRYQGPTVFSSNGMSPLIVLTSVVALAAFGSLFLRRGD